MKHPTDRLGTLDPCIPNAEVGGSEWRAGRRDVAGNIHGTESGTRCTIPDMLVQHPAGEVTQSRGWDL